MRIGSRHDGEATRAADTQVATMASDELPAFILPGHQAIPGSRK
eukprot:SAG11_NODE_7493_length_1137_cov_1.321773_2_plen_43_part_01